MNSALAPAVEFATSLPGLLLLILGRILVLVCLCSDMARLLCRSRSHGRYVANTVFRTLALPGMVIMAVTVVLDVASAAWLDLTLGMLILVTLIFRWHNNTDEDNWWKGKGKALGGWAGGQLAPRPAMAPATG